MSLPNPLDDSQPIPEYRAPGTEPPDVQGVPVPLAIEWDGGSPVYQSPDRPPEPNKGQLLKQQQIEALKREDADLRVMAAALRLTGRTVTEISRVLNVPTVRVRRVLRQARQDGNLTDTLNDLQFDALPLAIEKLIEKLEKGEEWAIRETLKGLGAFRHYTQQDNAGQQDNRQLQVNFIMPATPTTINPKGIVGTPRGQVVEGQIASAPEKTDEPT